MTPIPKPIQLYLLLAFGISYVLGLLWLFVHIEQVFRWSTLSALLLIFGLKLFLDGGFGEEFGWRGYIQPKLEETYSWLGASW